MNDNALAQKCYDALNKITKWRSIFAGWQLGSRPLGDPESDAVRDHREVTILERLEISALKQILVGVDFSQEDFNQALTTWSQGTDTSIDNAVQEHRAVTISLRAELSALINLLHQKGIITLEDYQKALIQECEYLEIDYQKRFPGMESTNMGMHFYDVEKAAKTTKNWKP
jgi:hypothetical protein